MASTMRSRIILACAFIVCVGWFSAVQTTASETDAHYEVTITNLTAHQIFTPILVVTHTRRLALFRPGQPASQALEMLAEGGDTMPLMDVLHARSDMVLDAVNSGGVLPPGESVTVKVQTEGDFNRVSVAAMLIPTNDAFMALRGVVGPMQMGQTVTRSVPVYDAGTEHNDQLCDHIPGPPDVCAGEGFNPSHDGAEGFVHIHRGIHETGDLSPATYDWRNPGARIRITRTR